MRALLVWTALGGLLTGCPETLPLPEEWELHSSTVVSATGLMAVRAPYLYVIGDDATDNAFAVIEVSADGNTATERGRVAIPLSVAPGPLAVGDDALYIAFREDLFVYDLADPARPTLATTFRLHEFTYDGLVDGLAVVGRHLYASVRARGLHIVDLADPLAPGAVTVVPAVDLTYFAANARGLYGVARDHNATYPDATLQSYDLVDPLSPAAFPTVEGAGGFFFATGNRLASGGNSLRLFDVSEGAPRQLAARTEMEGQPGIAMNAHSPALIGDVVFFSRPAESYVQAARPGDDGALEPIPGWIPSSGASGEGVPEICKCPQYHELLVVNTDGERVFATCWSNAHEKVLLVCGPRAS
jgi:hypothetical protein